MIIAKQQLNKTKFSSESQKNYFQSDLLIPFICLLLIEIIAFGINAKRVGIYQDEWITLSQLHFVPHSLDKIIAECFWNPRILIRPVEALHFGLLFYFVQENPLWYHIVCYIWEFLGGWFLFLALSRYIGDRSIALTAAVLFLLYPTHDVTHYEIVASSIAVSMGLFTASLWLYVKGIDENRYSLIVWSSFAYLLSIYNYELCLPFVILYPLLYILKQETPRKFLNNIKTFLVFQIPIISVALSMVLYRRWLFDIKLGYRYALVYDLSNFFTVIWSGVTVSLSPHTFQFCASMFREAIKSGLSMFSLACLLIAAGSVFVTLLKESPLPTPKGKAFSLIFIGAVTLLSSYTIYGFSPEHKPVIDAWLNRVNAGGALGACLIVAGIFALLRDCFTLGSKTIYTYFIKQSVFAIVMSVFTAALIIIDWQFAQPWIVSWRAQKELINALRTNANEIKSGDSIILGGIIRYASKWVPVADGVWDFGGLARTTLNNQQINATVVTERLSITENELVDKYGDIVLGKFPFKQMILCAPDKGKWLRISSRKEFIEQSKQLGWNVRETAQNK